MASFSDTPVSLQPKSAILPVTQAHVIQRQPERPKKLVDPGPLSSQNVILSTGQEILKETTVCATDKNIVPTIDAQSSSLMEGSGEFDPSDLSNINIMSHNLSEMTNMEIIQDQVVLRGHPNTPKDFESTKLLVNIDNEPPVQVNIGIVLADNGPNYTL